MTAAAAEQLTGGGSNGYPKKEKPHRGAEGIRLPPPLSRIAFSMLQAELPRKARLVAHLHSALAVRAQRSDHRALIVSRKAPIL